MTLIKLIDTKTGNIIECVFVAETKNFTIVAHLNYGSIKIRKDGSCTGIRSSLVRI